MLNKRKSGKSLIMLTIVICVMSFSLVFVCRFFDNSRIDNTTEEAFKMNVYEYCLELNDYKASKVEDEEFDEEDFYAYGVELQTIIPAMQDNDLSKFKIERGKLVYIGVNGQEKKWTKEVRI